MTRTLRTLITRLARDPQADEAHVHFHNGPQGHPAACHEARCTTPRLTT